MQKSRVSGALHFTLFIPDFKVDTKSARAVLPQNISREDAIFNMQRIALLPHAFEVGNVDLIKIVTEDKLHQQYRKNLFKNIDEIEKIAYECGAISFVVSGAGPSCLAISDKPLSDTLASKLEGKDNNWIAYTVTVDNEGAKEIYDEQ